MFIFVFLFTIIAGFTEQTFYVFVNENENFMRYKKYRTLRGFRKTC